jgi:hypothetical protein
MPGGGGGSKDKKRTRTTPGGTSSLPAYGNAPSSQTMQPMLPGFQNMLAQQLQAGYGSGGGGVPDFASMLSGMYSPMTMIDYNEPISQTAANYDAKKFAPINTGYPTLDKLLMGSGKVGAKEEKDKK